MLKNNDSGKERAISEKPEYRPNSNVMRLKREERPPHESEADNALFGDHDAQKKTKMSHKGIEYHNNVRL